jgi:adhesin transport system membrane fusion protein
MRNAADIDADFMGELEAAYRHKPRASSQFLLYSIAGLIVFFLAWANLCKVDERTRGEGEVVPSQSVQVVQSLEGGILQQLLVNEGDVVKKGQVLMRISDVQFSTQARGTEAQFLGLAAKQARLQAEANGTAFTLPADVLKKAPDIASNEQALHASRQQELQNSISMLDSKIDQARSAIEESRANIKRMSDSNVLQNQQLAITSKMVAQQAMPKLEELKLQKDISDTSGELRAEQQKLSGLQSELEGAQKERKDAQDKFRSQALGELNEAETQIAQLKESLSSIQDKVDRTEVRSPVDGIVNNIAIKTVGGVIEPAMKLVEIVPVDNQLKIVAKVLPKDIAFLKIGQPARVKITAYDAQRYGALDGRLVRIGANSTTDHDGHAFFEIEVRTDRNYLGSADHPMPISPGMVAETDIITGRKTIMEYLIRPFLRTKDKAFSER